MSTAPSFSDYFVIGMIVVAAIAIVAVAYWDDLPKLWKGPRGD
jgi:hypothetical protein